MATDIEAQEPWVTLRARMFANGDDEIRLEYARQWRVKGDLDPRRALLIEEQVEIEALAGGRDHPAWPALNRQIYRTLRQIEHIIAPSWFGTDVTDYIFHRGFIEQVTVPVSFLMEPRGRERLFACAPIMHLNITCTDSASELQSVLASPEFKKLSSVGLDAQNVDDDCILHLIRSASKNLRWLSLAHNRITERGVRALAEAYYDGSLRALHFVDFRGNPCDPTDLFEEDQGVVVGRRVSRLAGEMERDYGTLPWLHRPVVGGRVINPERLSASPQFYHATS